MIDSNEVVPFAFIEPPPVKTVVNPFAIERPHAAPHLLERQGSFRGLSQLNQSSPFKRQMSLRIGDLPSTVERQQNSLSNEAPGYKSNLIVTPDKWDTESNTLSPHLLPASVRRRCSSRFIFYTRTCILLPIIIYFPCNVLFRFVHLLDIFFSSSICDSPRCFRKPSASSSSQSSPCAAVSLPK